MSSLSASAIPGQSSGILHPKLNHHFVVRFLVQANVSEQEEKEIALALQALTMQTVSVKLPVRDLTSRAVGHSKLKNVLMKGALELCLEDDRGSRVVDALEYLATHPSLSILVLKLDGDEKVYNAYRFNNAKATSYEHSLLDYNGRGGSTAQGELVSFNEDGDKQIVDIALRYGGESNACKYTVKFDFGSAQFGSFPDGVDAKELF